MGFKHSSFHNKLESKHSFFGSLKQMTLLHHERETRYCMSSIDARALRSVRHRPTYTEKLPCYGKSSTKRVYQYHLFILLFCYLRSNSFIHLLLDSSSSVKFLQRDIILRKGLVTPQNGFVTFTGVIAPVWGQAGSTVIASCLAVIGGQPSAKDTSQNNRSSKESPWLSVASRPHLQPKVWRVTSLTFVSVSPCRAGTCASLEPRFPGFHSSLNSFQVREWNANWVSGPSTCVQQAFKHFLAFSRGDHSRAKPPGPRIPTSAASLPNHLRMNRGSLPFLLLP